MAIAFAGVLFFPIVLGLLVSGLFRLVDTLRSHGAARTAQARSLAASGATGVAGLGGTVAWLAWTGGPELDIRLATLPALGCTVAVLTAAVAELTWPRPGGNVRTASLGSRRPVRPSRLSWLAVVGLVAALVALVAGVVTAQPDGRSFGRSAGSVAAAGSPYPGLAYAAAVGAATAAPALATWFARSRVDARPALGPGHEQLDAAVRAVSMTRVLRPAAVGSLSTAGGLWLTIGATINTVTQNLRMNESQAAQPPFDWVQNAGFVATTLGVLLLLLTLAALVSGAPRFPRSEAAPARDVAGVGA